MRKGGGFPALHYWPPLGKGALGTEDVDCHTSDIGHWFAMTGSFTRDAVRRADVGSELSAAGGRGSEVSEWPRSKFPASAVRQRGNFGHRNRIIGPYGVGCREWVTLLVQAVCGASGGNHRDGCGFFWYL